MKPAGIRWVGPRALLVELPTLDVVLAYHAHLLKHPVPGQIDALAAAQTVLLKCDSRANALRAYETVQRLRPEPADDIDGETVDIEVVYDGEDIEAVGELTGLGVDGVISAHTGQSWRAAFGGFAPGFAYLTAENEAPDVPRRDSPRTAVPAGSVAMAGSFSAVYPSESPGGWQLIGRTSARMWDLARERPALVRPGDTVRFTQVDTLGERSAPAPDDAAEKESKSATGRSIEIVDPGIQSLIQDLGRPGYGDMGVPVAGAVDTSAARQANRLVGNAPGDALIENVLGGLVIRASGGTLVLARSGAEATAEIEGPRGNRPAPLRAPFPLYDDETLHVQAPTAGLRCYLGVRGGFDVAPVLGSRSTDSMSGIGPAPLAAGARVAVGLTGPAHIVGEREVSTLRLVAAGADDVATLRVTLGPRDDWFGRDGVGRLISQRWTATQQSNRIGIRFELADEATDEEPPAPLERVRSGELASEGVVAGALQVPPSGLPVLFLADYPVTGGYPVIAVVVPQDLSVAAQLVPGTAVRFVAVDPDTLEPSATSAHVDPSRAPKESTS
jgi:KipI family sensor histidine kinase inhibitor